MIAFNDRTRLTDPLENTARSGGFFLGPRSKGCGLFSEPKRVFEEEIAAAPKTTPEEMKVRIETGMVYAPFTLTIETKEAYRRIYGVDYLS